jgi:inner membrane protein involved in colicin E2 resistance
VALVILVAAHLVVLVGILWRILVEKGHNPLISALLVGALMLSVVASAVRVIESKRQG